MFSSEVGSLNGTLLQYLDVFQKYISQIQPAKHMREHSWEIWKKMKTEENV